MNRIEDQWHQLKVHEIAGQMFEDEYDLLEFRLNSSTSKKK